MSRTTCGNTNQTPGLDDKMKSLPNVSILLLCISLVPCGVGTACDDEQKATATSSGKAGSNTSPGPFTPDEHTVALYHFDEGKGSEAQDACGDPELTLRAHKQALWGKRRGFGSTAKFVRTKDDANLLIGPINNGKLELRTCPKAFTVEAWVRYTGPYRQDWGNTYGNICGTDEEGFSLPHGVRSGWNFSLHNWKEKDRLVPSGRLLASGSAFPYYGKGATIQQLAISDRNWHHVAWQFRYADQTHFPFPRRKALLEMVRPVATAEGPVRYSLPRRRLSPFTRSAVSNQQGQFRRRDR